MLSALACVIMAWAALSDLRARIIPNALPAALALLGLVQLATLSAPALQLAVAAALFALGFAAFLAGAVGGGDAKLLAAAGLWLPPATLSAFFTITALTGAVLALAVIARRRLVGARGGPPVEAPATVPYGAAIAVGFGVALLVPV